ncbi:MAG: SUMF1/EgtB/PvdO family nonheme iron enzyme [Gammaproteobacteria bacterium]
MAQSKDTLRGLSRGYAVGDIDREAYRLQRRELIGAVVAGERELVPFSAPAPESPTVFPYEDDEGDTTQEIIPAVAADLGTNAAAGGRGPLLAVVIVALCAAIGIGWWLWRPAAAPAPAASPAAAQHETAPAPDPVARFLAVNVWNLDSLNGFVAEWQDLDAAARAELVEHGALRRLGDAVLAQIAGETALMDLGDPRDALDAQERLLDFADRLAIDDARLERARREWHEARSRQPDGDPLETPAADDTARDTDVPSAAPEGAALPAPAEPGAVAARPLPLEPRRALAAPTPVDASPATTPSSVPARSNCSRDLVGAALPFCIDVVGDAFRGPALVVVAAGQFDMGGEGAHETPRHAVDISDPFALSMFEISAAELARYCADTGRNCPVQPWPEPALPAVNVNWYLARDYAAWLSELTGAEYRLPSEAEWEFAARAGSTAAYPSGRDQLAPDDARFGHGGANGRPLAANDRSLDGNAFRLYHMAGNVREWVADSWFDDHAGAPADGSVRRGEGALRVVRGGSYADDAGALRSAARAALAADTADAYTGFRVLRVLAN